MPGNNSERVQYRCIRTPLGPMGGTLFRRRAIYVIYNNEPDALYYLTINGSIGRKFKVSDVPRPFNKYFKIL